MKSHLRFKFSKEKCLELLKAETRFMTILKDYNEENSDNKKFKRLFGKYNNDDTFEVRAISFYRGNLGPLMKGSAEDLDHEVYKCKIFVETGESNYKWIFVAFAVVIAFLVASIIGALIALGFCLIILLSSEHSTKTGIHTLIDCIESHYEND